MHCRWMTTVYLVLGCLVTSGVHADDPTSNLDQVHAAVARAIPLLEKASAGSADQRKCFTCHSQALPTLAFAEARKRGFAIDDANFKRQIKHTSAHLERGRENYLKGKGQGGRIITAGYALWTLDASGWKADETTAAVTHFMLEHQKEADHWKQSSKRPPTSGSSFMATYVALRGLKAFGTKEQSKRVTARKIKVKTWLLKAKPKDTEDRVFRLRALPFADANKKLIQSATEALISDQHDDGGWGQKSDMKSDAYATGTVLAALLEAGTTPDNGVVKRGIKYLLDTQLDDGSWHVTTRADGFQEYFETGFPHEDDQFISTAASAWSTLALLLTLPESSKPLPSAKK